MPDLTYIEQQRQKNTLHLRELICCLPKFIDVFFRSIAQNTSIKTRIAYAYDLRIFFNYLIKNNPFFSDKKIENISAHDMEKVQSEDIDLFLEYVTYYEKDNPVNESEVIIYTNDEKGKLRKLSAIRRMYKFLYSKKLVAANPAEIVESPKIHEKAIVRMDVNEMCNFLDEVEKGNNLTSHQKIYHKYTQKRDLAIVSLLLGTGMRVSECVGVDKKDINFENNAVKVTRKGGNETVLYFGDEVRDAILDYMEERKNDPFDTEDALFISMQKKRIDVRTVQNLVKKYAKASVQIKNISPHKLRSTYGTNLYNETGDIYLVAETLGHVDVNTTRKHYAQMEDNRRRSAAKYIKLRRE
ncbi:MAG: tyrosine-type recombinase/integrase [Firmicutes bacterium]|nr:tyrosine-type recombinase/integrase [Bacillota bacterium]